MPKSRPGRTAKAVLITRKRKPGTKSAPLTAAQRKQKREAREETTQAIDADIDEWFTMTMTKAEELAEKYNKKPRYFTDRFFQGGARLVHGHRTTSWNAFLSKKTEEVNGGKSFTQCLIEALLIVSDWVDDASGSTSLVDIIKDHRDEYEELSNEEKKEMVQEFTKEKESLKKLPHPTARGRVQDVLNVVRNIEQLVSVFLFFTSRSLDSFLDDGLKLPCWD
jgi:hypothetical protein